MKIFIINNKFVKLLSLLFLVSIFQIVLLPSTFNLIKSQTKNILLMDKIFYTKLLNNIYIKTCNSYLALESPKESLVNSICKLERPNFFSK